MIADDDVRRAQILLSVALLENPTLAIVMITSMTVASMTDSTIRPRAAPAARLAAWA